MGVIFSNVRYIRDDKNQFAMIIFNTTYHVEISAVEEFIDYLKREFVPAATADGEMKSPRLTEVLADLPEGEVEGQSLALQFEVTDVDRLDEWYNRVGSDLNDDLVARFDARVIGFTTLLRVIDL
jgi:hypothetical protein